MSLSVSGAKYLRSHNISPSADEEPKKMKRPAKAEQDDVPADQSSLKRTTPLSSPPEVKSAKLDLDKGVSALEEELSEEDEEVTRQSLIVESGTKAHAEPDITSSTCVGIEAHLKDTAGDTGKKPVLCNNVCVSYRIIALVFRCPLVCAHLAYVISVSQCVTL